MRRNSRGGQRGGQHWQSRSSGGPLMTEHIGLQDIDKELDLLKRKREIIEQQQQILSNEFRMNDYQEPRYSQSSRFDEYAQLYDNMRDYDHPSRKRPIAVWEDDIPTKRFSGPTRARSRQYSHQEPPPQRSGPTRGNYNVSKTRPAFRPQSGPFKPKSQPKKDTSKVTKSVAPINQMNTYPTAERKKLVTEAISQTADAKLRPDCEPSKQVNGRLELALGSILKDIKTKADAEAIQPPNVMRIIKKTIRERIREVMMNQVVGSGDAIKARYREKYNEQSDLEIVTNALEIQSAQLTLMKLGDPATYFKTNMQKIMQKKLQCLLQKLEEVYYKEYTKTPSESGVAIENKPVEENPENKPAEENPENKPAEENPENKPAEKNPESKPAEENPENKPAEENPDVEDNVVKKVEKKDNIVLDETITNTDQFKTLEKLLMNKLVVLMKKSVPQILKIMDIDSRYLKLKNTIKTGTVKMLMAQEPEENGEAVSEPTTKVKSPKTPHKPMPYFAKLMGKPNLPKRNSMEKFFEEYQPKSIKKHRTVHNLLFIGFLEKEHLDKFLAADGTKIGKHTLSIRPSERSNPEPKVLDTSTSLEDKIIGTDLDEQISDLLTSIKKQEAEENGEQSVNGKEATNGDLSIKPEVNTNAIDATEICTENNENINEISDDDANNLTENAVDGNLQVDIEEAHEGNAAEVKENFAEEFQMNENGAEEVEKVDQVPELVTEIKPKAVGTPARTSARLTTTPSRIQTRRSSRAPQNDA